jgi:hypothetical protein
MYNMDKIVAGKYSGNRPIGLLKIWEDNIKIELREIIFEVVDWIEL